MRNTLAVQWLRRKALPVVLAGGLCVCGWGCHQHYYYYGNPPAGVGALPARDDRTAQRGERRAAL